MADTEKDVNRAAAAPQEEASAAQAAPEAPQPETQDAEKTEKKEKHAEGKAHAELAALKTKLEQAEKKLAETKDTLLRTAAEYENFRKRSAREHDAAFDNGVSFAVNTLLPVLDTLEIAADAPTADESYKKGVTDDAGQMPRGVRQNGCQRDRGAGQALRPRAARSCAAAALYRRHAQRHRHAGDAERLSAPRQGHPPRGRGCVRIG